MRLDVPARKWPRMATLGWMPGSLLAGMDTGYCIWHVTAKFDGPLRQQGAASAFKVLWEVLDAIDTSAFNDLFPVVL
jgi:hypothetical protein